VPDAGWTGGLNATGLRRSNILIMKEERVFRWRDRLGSFRPACSGWRRLVAEPNMRIHLGIATLVVGAGLVLEVSRLEWIALLLCIGLVLGLEALNSALEDLADAVHPGQHPLVGRAKDRAAAAVLVAALVSVAVGVLVFGPKLLALLGSPAD
jgi:diacylglycerol kinase (ATP)